MPASREEIVREIERLRADISDLESQLGQLGQPPAPAWPPAEFYLTFYVVTGAIIGIVGSVTSFLFHIVGSVLVEQDPLLFLRVYGTMFLGQEALTTQDLNFFMLVAIAHFCVGASAGAVFHVAVNWFIPDRPALQVGLGALYGLLMWVVNFYVVVLWVQPQLVGEAYILQLMPAWVAIVTHLIYGLTLGILQPLGRFVPYRPAMSGSETEPLDG